MWWCVLCCVIGSDVCGPHTWRGRRATKSTAGDSGATATEAAATAGAGAARRAAASSACGHRHTHPLFTTRAANFHTYLCTADST